MKLTGAQIIIETLIDHGVEVIFGYPGAAVIHLYDELLRQDKIKHILVRHEQAAIHAAEGYARATGKVGVAVVTSGPGATNTVTGIADALMDSTPIVCITGQVARALIGQSAFQEADVTGITRSISKYNSIVYEPDELAYKLQEAFYISKSGRPGPVVIDIPMDIQAQEISYEKKPYQKRASYRMPSTIDDTSLSQAAALIQQAKRPVIYGGGGLIHSGAADVFRAFAKKTGFPDTLTLMGLGAYPASDPQFLGMLGMHGSYQANKAMHGSDLIIAVGARFDNRVTAALEKFAPDAAVIHIDIDETSIDKTVWADVGIVGDAAQVLTALNQKITHVADISAWNAQIEAWKSVDCFKIENETADMIKPQSVIKKLSAMTAGKDVGILTDVGQHQMFTANYFKFEKPRQFITSGGFGTMGYGMPATIGANLAIPDKTFVCISGDGSFLMNVQELATAAVYNIPIKVIIINNGYLGMVKQVQDVCFGSRYSQVSLDKAPDFVKIAHAFGCDGARIETYTQLEAGLAQMLASDKPFILDIKTSADEACLPMIKFGGGHDDMILQQKGK
ncbi:MAG: biosynthetic-type acetolactate synthase large subunit [Lactobacillales bacterium]|nr:biosynthetic-type acetolactate synthase large subunit [Lactobacillales bacterium]